MCVCVSEIEREGERRERESMCVCLRAIDFVYLFEVYQRMGQNDIDNKIYIFIKTRV